MASPLPRPNVPANAFGASQLKRHERGVVCGFSDDGFAQKYMCMGVTQGSCVELVRKAPFGNACYFKVDGRTLAVRREEAACLLIQRMADSL